MQIYYCSFRIIIAHSVLLLLIQYIIAHLNSLLLNFNIAHLNHFIAHLDYFIAQLNISLFRPAVRDTHMCSHCRPTFTEKSNFIITKFINLYIIDNNSLNVELYWKVFVTSFRCNSSFYLKYYLKFFCRRRRPRSRQLVIFFITIVSDYKHSSLHLLFQKLEKLTLQQLSSESDKKFLKFFPNQ